MATQIFITTSNGVYRYRSGETHAERVLGKKHTPGLFRRKGRGYFGICLHQPSRRLLVASRERLGTPKAGKPTTDCKLVWLDPISGAYSVAAEIRDVHDVHQIACHGDHVFLTDTGKNRLFDYDLATGELAHIVNIGSERKDINHLNALCCDDIQLHIGLNNRGNQESAIMTVAIDELIGTPEREITLDTAGTSRSLPGMYHTHDIEPYEGDFLVCSSEAGRVLRAGQGTTVIQQNGWVRGLCVSAEGIWVGISPKAKRKNRHSDSLSGSILLHTHGDFAQARTITLEGSGQVNDLLCLEA